MTPRDLGSRDHSSEVSVIAATDGTLVAWKTGMSGIRVAHVREGGEVVADELFLSDAAAPTSGGPAVAWSGDRYLVGWQEEGASGASSFRVRRFHADLSEEGEVVPVVEDDITGEAHLAFLDGKFVALWASGSGRSLLRHALIDPHSADARKRIVGAGAGPFDELQIEAYAGAILASWRGGRIVVEQNGDVRGSPSEVGARERDARPPSWTQNEAPALPEGLLAFGRGLPRGDELLVPWIEQTQVRYGAFGTDGRLARGPWTVAETDPGPTPVQVGMGPAGDRVAVVYPDEGGVRVKLAVFDPCP